MTEMVTPMTDLLWRNGLAVLPLVLLVAVVTRFAPCRPSTKHLLWGMVLVWLVIPPLVPAVDLSSRLVEAAAGDVVGSDVAAEPQSPDDAVRILADRVAALSDDLLTATLDTVDLGDSGFVADTDEDFPPPLARSVERTPNTLARAFVPDGRWPNVFPPAPQAHVDEQLLTPITEASSSDSFLTRPAIVAQPEAVWHDTSERVGADAPVRKPAAWRAWMASIVAVRDAVGRIPAIPSSLWIGGVAALGLICLIRLVALVFRVREASPADRSVRRLVLRAAKRMRLRRVPVVLMVEDRVSPMVSCGLWPRLILPRRLWAELDDAGREAVVCHELAHLRRCDHLVVWADTFVGLLYWWHPLVWWVRSRLHAEAENCCDAWVTTLRPAARRVYAQTLLRTREYLSGEPRAWPAMTVGMTSGRAKRFSRRLTMVMTNRVKPGLSAPGVVLALAVAVMGWLVSPAQSCPNEKSPRGLIEGQTTHDVHLAADEPRGEGVAGVRLVSDHGDDDGYGRIQERMERLERQLDELMRAMERDEGHRDRRPRDHRRRERRDGHERAEREHGKPGHGGDHRCGECGHRGPDHHGDRGHGERGPDGDRWLPGPRGQMGPHAFADPPRPPAPRPPHAPRHPRPPHPPRVFRPGDGHMSWRTYELPGEKLEAFTALMALDEVPILVRPGKGSIEIQATDHQHDLFEAFFRMIGNGEAHARYMPVPPSGPRGAWAAGPGREYVAPARVPGCHGKPGCKHGKAGCKHGATKPGRCADCQKHGKSAAARRTMKKAQKLVRRGLARVQAELSGEVAELREQARAGARRARRQMRKQIRDIRTKAESHEALLESLHEQVETLRNEAESYRDKAETIRDRAEAWRDRMAEELGDAETRADLEEQLLGLIRGAADLEGKAVSMEDIAQIFEDKSRAVEEQLRSFETYVDQLVDSAVVEPAVPESEAVEITAVAPNVSAEEVEVSVVIDEAPKTVDSQNSQVADDVAKALKASLAVVEGETKPTNVVGERQDRD